MKCVIIAAGYGSRLNAISGSKPLAALEGVPLIEHVVRRLAMGGASAFVVVTGHRAAELEPFLAGLGQRLGLPIRCVRTDDWQRANGHSVLSAEPVAGDARFLLSMADHLFDPGIVAALIANGLRESALCLAVDRRLDNPLIDPADATRVALDEDRIVRIGKGIERFDATDTGLFLVSPALYAALRDSIADGNGSLSGGVQKLADRGQALTMDIGDRWWIDVDDPPSFAAAEAALRQPVS